MKNVIYFLAVHCVLWARANGVSPCHADDACFIPDDGSYAICRTIGRNDSNGQGIDQVSSNSLRFGDNIALTTTMQAARSIALQYGRSGGRDVDVSSDLSGAHISLNYWCCLFTTEIPALIDALTSVQWEVFNIQFDDIGCIYIWNGGEVSVVANADAASQLLLMNLTRRIAAASAARGIPIVNPRVIPFHLSIANINITGSYPLDVVRTRIANELSWPVLPVTFISFNSKNYYASNYETWLSQQQGDSTDDDDTDNTTRTVLVILLVFLLLFVAGAATYFVRYRRYSNTKRMLTSDTPLARDTGTSMFGDDSMPKLTLDPLYSVPLQDTNNSTHVCPSPPTKATLSAANKAGSATSHPRDTDTQSESGSTFDESMFELENEQSNVFHTHQLQSTKLGMGGGSTGYDRNGSGGLADDDTQNVESYYAPGGRVHLSSSMEPDSPSTRHSRKPNSVSNSIHDDTVRNESATAGVGISSPRTKSTVDDFG